MAKYQANPVVVDAFVIVQVDARVERGGDDDIPAHKLTNVVVRLEGKEDSASIPKEMLARMTPVPGDYYVIQEDGYAYLNPKAVFERKYSPLIEPDLKPNPSLAYRKEV